ncbi:hypothetical protein [Paraburkholderia atlantica]|uniref:hypothetical protein n=1 Tax=Paraburkholderia atlantica TaxID=2654982 RepID=UPI001C37656E|nr:hypothetical protein [Paraburkholderia atlantica]
MDEKKTGLQRLREPFPEHQISLLPKPLKRDAPKGKCQECGGYHGLPAIHLSYVGHAALTDRLLECDESWSWEPVAFGPDGLPLLDRDGGMWIRLTVCGVTRLGYGDAQGKTGPDAMKERIGDALRNAAMRFGAALDLWHKGELHKDEEPESKPAPSGLDNEIADLQIAMREAESIEDLERISAPIKDLPISDEQRLALSVAYSKRKRELKTAA